MSWTWICVGRGWALGLNFKFVRLTLHKRTNLEMGYFLGILYRPIKKTKIYPTKNIKISIFLSLHLSKWLLSFETLIVRRWRQTGTSYSPAEIRPNHLIKNHKYFYKIFVLGRNGKVKILFGAEIDFFLGACKSLFVHWIISSWILSVFLICDILFFIHLVACL